jgi:hypothetical protein
MQLHTTNTTPQKTKNTNTMISPTRRLPVALIFEVTAITIRHAIVLDLQNKAMMQFFYVKLMNSLLYLLLFSKPLTSVLMD